MISTSRSKYNISKVRWRNIVFDSNAEAARYEVLLRKEAAGAIDCLRYHKMRFVIGKNDKDRLTWYTPDFTMIENGLLVAEEVKGPRVRDWPIRAAAFIALFPEWDLRTVEAGSKRKAR